MAPSLRFARVERLERFPRWRVWNRVLAHATEDMATLGGAVLVAVAFALVGAFAVFPRGANWFARFSAGLGVAAMALVAAWGLVLAYRAVKYRRSGDPVWEIAWSISETRHQSRGVTTRTNGVSLICRGRPPVNISTLGHVEAVVRLPGGHVRQMAQEGMGGDGTTLWFAPALNAPFMPGTYEVRWYGTTARRRRYEIARSKYTVPNDT